MGESTEIPVWLIWATPIIIAVIGGGITLIVRMIRGPVTIQDLWAENRARRDEIDTLREQVRGLIEGQETQKFVGRVMGDGYDAYESFVDREHEISQTKPRFTIAEREAIERAKALRGDDELWVTMQRVDRVK